MHGGTGNRTQQTDLRCARHSETIDFVIYIFYRAQVGAMTRSLRIACVQYLGFARVSSACNVAVHMSGIYLSRYAFLSLRTNPTRCASKKNVQSYKICIKKEVEDT